MNTRQIILKDLPADTETFHASFEEDYALLLVVSSPVDRLRRKRIASDIVNSPCRYALTFGHECEKWHDAIDAACLENDALGTRFLMTTWHDDEPIEDVIDFLWWNTVYDDFEAERLAVVRIGGDTWLDDAIRRRIIYLQS